MRRFIGPFLVGALGGFLASGFVLPFLAKVNFLNSAVILNKFIKLETVVTRVEEKTVVVPKTDYFSEAINRIEPSVAAIQSFQSGQLIRSGSGLVLTRDGLIAVSAGLVPSQTEVIQAIISDRIFKGKVLFYQPQSNLVLISIGENNLQVTEFETDLPELGRNLLLVSKISNFGKDVLSVAPALVSQIEENQEAFKVALAFDANFFGSVLINGEGKALGMVEFRNLKPRVIMAHQVIETLNAYLAQVSK